MKILVHGRNVEVNDWIQEYIEKKVAKLERHLPQVTEVRAELVYAETRSADDRYTCQLTLAAGGQTLRAEESTGDIFASIDATVDKLQRQIRRFKGRRYKGKRRAGVASAEAQIAAMAVETPVEEEEEGGAIIRRKRFVMQPMNEEEALEQMELLGHDFFIFLNPDTNTANVIYRRKDGNYGVLQPDLV